MASTPLTADDAVPRHDVPTGGRSGFTVVDDRQVHYLEWGTVRAPNVVCLHGGGQTAYMYEELGAALAPKYHVLAPDLPSHGDSDPIDEIGRHALADTLPALFEHFGIAPSVVVVRAHLAASRRSRSAPPIRSSSAASSSSTSAIASRRTASSASSSS